MPLAACRLPVVPCRAEFFYPSSIAQVPNIAMATITIIIINSISPAFWYLTPDPISPQFPQAVYTVVFGSGLKFGQAPPARAEAIVISDLTPDPLKRSIGFPRSSRIMDLGSRAMHLRVVLNITFKPERTSTLGDKHPFGYS